MVPHARQFYLYTVSIYILCIYLKLSIIFRMFLVWSFSVDFLGKLKSMKRYVVTYLFALEFHFPFLLGRPFFLYFSSFVNNKWFPSTFFCSFHWFRYAPKCIPLSINFQPSPGYEVKMSIEILSHINSSVVFFSIPSYFAIYSSLKVTTNWFQSAHFNRKWIV